MDKLKELGIETPKDLGHYIADDAEQLMKSLKIKKSCRPLPFYHLEIDDLHVDLMGRVLQFRKDYKFFAQVSGDEFTVNLFVLEGEENKGYWEYRNWEYGEQTFFELTKRSSHIRRDSDISSFPEEIDILELWQNFKSELSVALETHQLSVDSEV